MNYDYEEENSEVSLLLKCRHINSTTFARTINLNFNLIIILMKNKFNDDRLLQMITSLNKKIFFIILFK